MCALGCEGLGGIDWSNDRGACLYFSRQGYSCLSDCGPNELNMGGVSLKDLPRQCHWTLLGCPDLLFPADPEAVATTQGDFCPDVCQHTECVRTYEQLIATKRHLDLHRRCAVNCK